MKTLYIDIETSPNVAHVWSLWQQNVSLSQLQDVTEVLCFAAKWRGKRGLAFSSVHGDGHDAMVEKAHALLDEADVVVHYNGRSFDVPHLNREFLLAGYTPPAPFQQIDLLSAVKKRFRFTSNKLAHVSEALGLGGKVAHEGHDLWVKCLAGDAAAWKRMERYNKQDVRLLEDLHDTLAPWVPNHPNVALYDGGPGEEHKCPVCGGTDLRRKGWAYTQVSRYQRYRCHDCGKYTRSGKREDGTGIRQVAD